jgi:hypothetical protein
LNLGIIPRKPPPIVSIPPKIRIRLHPAKERPRIDHTGERELTDLPLRVPIGGRSGNHASSRIRSLALDPPLQPLAEPKLILDGSTSSSGKAPKSGRDDLHDCKKAGREYCGRFWGEYAAC